jgi:prolyl-tRNA editing enzyme YbaK/EbsC (Cys-tRNA(Pro) deacylase)
MLIDDGNFEQMIKKMGINSIEFIPAKKGHTRTVTSAARALQLNQEDSWRIAKTLVWREELASSIKRFYIFCSGTNRVDQFYISKLAEEHWKSGILKPATPDEVILSTGFSIGAVAPFPKAIPLSSFEWFGLFDSKLFSLGKGIDNIVFVSGPRPDGLYSVLINELWEAWANWVSNKRVIRW